MVTNSGIEGNYTDGNRGLTPHWLEYAKATCVGKNLVELLPKIPSSAAFGGGKRGGGATDGRGPAGPGAGRGAGARGGGFGGRDGVFSGGFGFSRGRPRGQADSADLAAAYVDVMLWDILGKAVNLPIYKLLGGTKDRILAYSSSQHLATVEDFIPNALEAQKAGFKAYKIHPGGGQHRDGGSIPAYMGHIDEIREVRKACGENYTLLFDPVQRYNVFEALKVGHALEEYGYVSFEDPIPSTDIDGLIELREKLNVPIEVGEFLYSVSDYADYIKHGAMDIVRLIADNVGGISGAFRIAQLADAFGMPCTPHNWGNAYDLAVHFHIELASPNCFWFEMPNSAEQTDRVYMKEKFRIDKDGYVLAPKYPGLGYPLDRDALDKIMIRIDR
jgi:L-alanine-DL-glutamate epimerase-like enolase superfamily enzyme